MEFKYLIKNGKYFLPPPRDGSNFKEVFNRLASAGAGRPVDEQGFSSGPWTPELLAEAISQIDANRNGIDLRTVQLWFQDNEKGISTNNIHWLARIFGCDDPAATNEWQMELSAAQSRLTSTRREARRGAGSRDVLKGLNVGGMATSDNETVSPAKLSRDYDATGSNRGFSLARKSEAIFGRGSTLDLPASVFAGAVVLGFFSYLTGMHSVPYERLDGTVQQVGFLWAPNWTLLFMVLLPLFLAFVAELLIFWKHEGRLELAVEGDRTESDDGWARSVESSSFTYWAVFLICLLVAGLFQWIGTRLNPLLKGNLGNYAMDWGAIAIVHPEIISVPETVGFTGFAYLYMSVCFYLFFVGLILLFTLTHDLWNIWGASKFRLHVDYQRAAREVGLKVMCGIFRCTVLGILIPICMKLQSSYLTSSGENIIDWLVDDFVSVFDSRDALSDWSNYSMPVQYSSLVVVLATCIVFLYGSLRIHAIWDHQAESARSQFHALWWKMTAVVALLVASYLLIGVFAGFSILLGIGVLLAIYGMFDPGFRTEQANGLGDNQDVS